jgi:hypothetical protein
MTKIYFHMLNLSLFMLGWICTVYLSIVQLKDVLYFYIKFLTRICTIKIDLHVCQKLSSRDCYIISRCSSVL